MSAAGLELHPMDETRSLQPMAYKARVRIALLPSKCLPLLPCPLGGGWKKSLGCLF